MSNWSNIPFSYELVFCLCRVHITRCQRCNDDLAGGQAEQVAVFVCSNISLYLYPSYCSRSCRCSVSSVSFQL